jgi:CRISPR-associated protein Csb2
MSLAIRIQFLAGYSGREWPPSPARLFKALVSAARAGWAAANRAVLDDSLRVLERQGWEDGTSLPEIGAPRATLIRPQQRRFVPNNSKNWPTERRLNPVKGIDLEPEPIMRWEIDAPCVLWYWWRDFPSDRVATVREIARRVPSVGKGEDLAVLDAVEQEPPAELTRWRPSAGAPVDARFEVPEPGCLDVCDALFARASDDPLLPSLGVQTVSYVSDSDAQPQPPPVSVLALWRGGKRFSLDARLLRQVVGPIRNLLDNIRIEIVDLLVRSPGERPAMEALVSRVLLGHDENGQPVAEPHLAVLPIPSVLGPYPDGRVRRIALVGFGCAADPTRREIVEMAHILLHGQELRDNGGKTGIVLRTEPDGQWLQTISRTSRAWVTVTPMVQVAKELTSAEWKRLRDAREAADQQPAEFVRLEKRLRDRRLELAVRALRQAIADQDARPVSVECAAGGPIAGVHIASQYRVSGYLAETPRLHLRVTFDRPVAGPIAVGRGRHVGYGLLWPTEGKCEAV